MKNFFAACLCMLLFYPVTAQDRFTLSGYVKDQKTGEELIGVTVYIQEIRNGVTSNPYGFYSITLPAGTYQVMYSFIGYQPVKETIELRSNQSRNVQLTEETTQLREVEVVGTVEEKPATNIQISKSRINIEQMKQLPALFGEPDLIKMVQMQPGVITAGEGTSAFFVRGGGADQNLILLDEAPVYDPSHFFGLFSVFNADVIKSSELYRGGIPAQYGGRLSSLLDVRTKDGNNQNLAGSGSIGTLASKIMLEGPIQREKSSFLLSGRRSYADVLAKAFGSELPVYFYDLNAKVNWKPSNKDRFFAAAYLGRDVLNFGDNIGGIGWGNQTTTLRWNHLYNEKFFSNTTAIFSNFDYSLRFNDPAQGFEWTANKQEVALKQDMTYFPHPNHEISFGVQAAYHRFSPGRISPRGERSIFGTTQLDKMYATDYALYAGNIHKISPRLTLQYGIRYTIFQQVGAGDIKEYADLRDNVNPVVTGIRSYGSLEPIKTFHNAEPRFMAMYLLNQESSVKASYQRTVQYIHLISNSTVPIPFNTWAPSGEYLNPQKADQFTAGYFRDFGDGAFEFSTEVYYKNMRDLTDFADNAIIFFNPNIATEFRQGTGESYGLELSITKKTGKLTGFGSYTLSKTDRIVPDVNFGQPFLADYDRRHSLNLAATYLLTQRVTLGANFVYFTGRPITLPTGKYVYDGYAIDYFTERNGYKLPDFHRLDLSVTFDSKKNANRKWKTYKNISVYNVYNRMNPFTIYTRVKQDKEGNIIGDGTEKEARLVALFPILPSFSYQVKF